ncbi:hypothetical protein LKL35_24705 [Streptomyces sp. ET3-23]|uniref:toxin glutamine deamidase domain-containing protein n=1 Tax=Streptomyces sp. ET3-23 TaxID=2885643 RepID=UPI001D10AD7F|nr:toxin glutamine deamidase domain-containing protein [Streptomyces sp. ET3-23]MCC2278602.1 hypothetical protein [Streptomyces sp. ET3-23]
MLDPSQIWLFTGDFDALEKDAAGLKKDAGSIRDTGGDIHSQFQGLVAYYHAPEADQLFKTTLPVRDKSKDFAGDLEKVSSALTEFASEGRPLADKLKSLKREAEQFVSSVKGDKDWEYDKKKTDHHNRIRDDIDAAVAAFQEAERRCANKITGLYKGGTHWTADDGSHGKGMYGFKAEDLKHAKLPWGEPVDQKHHWYEVGHWIKSFVWDGIVVDGIWGTVKGLGTLVGVDGWDKAGQAWTGLAKLATGLAISSLPGVGPAFWAMPADKLPSWLRDSRTAVKETGKALVAWDEWSKNPARAAGGVTFNVLTTVFTGGSGTAAKAGAVAKTVSVLGKAGKFIDPMTYIGKGLGKGMSALNISVPKVGDLMAGLRDSLGGTKVSPADISLPHDMDIHVPETPTAVPTVFHDSSVKLPDGTVLHGDGRMASPEGVPHQDPIPVEAHAADRAAHQQVSASVPSHVPAHAEQSALVHAGGGGSTADHAVHGGVHHGGESQPTHTEPHHGGDGSSPHDGTHGTGHDSTVHDSGTHDRGGHEHSGHEHSGHEHNGHDAPADHAEHDHTGHDTGHDSDHDSSHHDSHSEHPDHHDAADSSPPNDPSGKRKEPLYTPRNPVPPHSTATATHLDIRHEMLGGHRGLKEPYAIDQVLLEDAVPKDAAGNFERFPDPTDRWARMQNDGGPTMPGRSNNCADCARSFMETWYGNPQVSAPRTWDLDAAGNLDRWSPERNGVTNAERWAGAGYRYAGEGPAYAEVASELLRGGHGSSAYISVNWPQGGGHAFNAVNHRGRIYWVDTQDGSVSTYPLHHGADGVWYIPLDANRRPILPLPPKPTYAPTVPPAVK